MYEHDREEHTRFPQNRTYTVTLPKPELSRLGEMRDYLEGRNLDYHVARYNGWYPSTEAGDQLPRIVMPCSINKWGYYWQARAMISEQNWASASHSQYLSSGIKPKPLLRYQSPHAPREEALGRLYATTGPAGMANTMKWPLLVTEGPTDALAGCMLGVDVVFLMGLTPPTAAKVALAAIARSYTQLIFVADADSLDGMLKVMVYYAGLGFQTTVVSPPQDCKDLAEASEEARAAWFKGTACHP